MDNNKKNSASSKKMGKNVLEEYSTDLGPITTSISAESLSELTSDTTGYATPDINQEAAEEFAADRTVIATPGDLGMAQSKAGKSAKQKENN